MTSLFGGGAKAVSKTPTRAMGIDLQGSQYGPPIPVVFGQNKVAGNVIWYGDFKATSHTQKQPGKGGGGSSSTSYTYSCSFELGLCEGVASVVNVYQGSSTVSLSRSGGIAFSGTTGQAAWSHLTGSAALGYSGTALAAFQNLELGSSASLPNFNFEVAARNQFGGGVVDANPADIVSAICTDTQIGVGFSALGDLTAFKNYCTAAGIFFSPVYSTQNPAHQTLDDLFKYANAAPFFSEGVLKVVPYGDATITGNGVTYTPSNTAVVDLGRDDFITNGPGDPVTIHRISPADAMNLVRVEYKDRANTYHTNAVVASIDQDVVGTGSRADQSHSVDMITQASVARMVAQNLLQRIYYIRNTYEFQLSWRYCYLEPMDIVTLTDANTGLYLTPVRITDIGEDEHGLLSVTAEEFPEGVSHSDPYGTQDNAGATVDPNADPGPIDAPYLFRGPGFLVSNNTPEIWCALTGNSALWAGCDVYISHDGTSYNYLATTSKSAAYGHLTNTLASASDPDTTGAPNVVLNGAAQLLGGSTTDADQFMTLCMLDNELMAYATATLASGPSYTLGYLRRGGYGSSIASHAVNAPFVRLDDNILRIPVDPSLIGQTVYLKFVSFNVFGRGGRTLADETAYTYVVGTNIELPDVPVTPASFAAAGVADGVSLTWTNPNPAAVGSTVIEYAATSTGPWTVLAQVGATTTSYAHHFTNGATYFYRARSRGVVVSAGFSAYTSVVSNSGTNVGAISTIASTAAANTPSVINPFFSNGTTGWSVPNAGWYKEAAGSSHQPDPVVPTYCVHAGSTLVSGSLADDVLPNTGHLNVNPGQIVTATCCIRELTVNSGATARVYISWRNSAGSEIAASQADGSTTYPTCGASGSGTYTQCVSRATGTAPSGAAYAVLALLVNSHTSGYFTFCGGQISFLPSTLDEVPNGAVNINSIQSSVSEVVDNAGFDVGSSFPPVGWLNGSGGLGSSITSPYYDSTYQYAGKQSLVFTAAQYSGYMSARKYQVNVGDTWLVGGAVNNVGGTANAATVGFQFYSAAGSLLGSITASNPGGSGYVKVSASGTVPSGAAYAQMVVYNNATGSQTVAFDALTLARVRSLDNEIGDGTNYGRTSQLDLYSSGGFNRVGLRVAGSGHRVGDQRNLIQRTITNFPAKVPTSITYSASAGTPATATISIAAFTVLAGSVSIAYNAMSVGVTGVSGGTSTFYLYFDDPTYAGGTQTLVATTTSNNVYANDGRVYAGSIQITFPSSGTSSGSGGGGGVVSCVCDTMLIGAGLYAGDVQVGDVFDCLDIPTSGMRKFRRRLIGVERETVDCVRLTTDAGAALDCSVTTPFDLPDGGTAFAPDMQGLQVVTDRGIETVSTVEAIGKHPVSHIHLGGCSYAAGVDPTHRIYSHNSVKP